MSTQDTAADTQAAIDTAVAAANAAAATAQTAAVAEAVAAEKQRVAGITGCDEAKGREALATHLAMNTAMSVDDAKATLAAAPVIAAPAPVDPAASTQTPFDAAMDQSDNPNVGTDGQQTDAAKEDGSDIVALAAAAGLKGFAAPAGK